MNTDKNKCDHPAHELTVVGFQCTERDDTIGFHTFVIVKCNVCEKVIELAGDIGRGG